VAILLRPDQSTAVTCGKYFGLPGANSISYPQANPQQGTCHLIGVCGNAVQAGERVAAPQSHGAVLPAGRQHPLPCARPLCQGCLKRRIISTFPFHSRTGAWYRSRCTMGRAPDRRPDHEPCQHGRRNSPAHSLPTAQPPHETGRLRCRASLAAKGLHACDVIAVKTAKVWRECCDLQDNGAAWLSYLSAEQASGSRFVVANATPVLRCALAYRGRRAAAARAARNASSQFPSLRKAAD